MVNQRIVKVERGVSQFNGVYAFHVDDSFAHRQSLRGESVELYTLERGIMEELYVSERGEEPCQVSDVLDYLIDNGVKLVYTRDIPLFGFSNLSRDSDLKNYANNVRRGMLTPEEIEEFRSRGIVVVRLRGFL